MAILVTDNKVFADGNGVATVFSFNPVRINEETDLVVLLIDDQGIEGDPLTLNVDYSTSPVGSKYPDTGSVTYPLAGDPLPTGWRILMYRRTKQLQETVLENQGGYNPKVQEQTFDISRMIDQDQEERIGRGIKMSIGTPAGFDARFKATPDTAPFVSSDGLSLENVTREELKGDPGPQGPEGPQGGGLEAVEDDPAPKINASAPGLDMNGVGLIATGVAADIDVPVSGKGAGRLTARDPLTSTQYPVITTRNPAMRGDGYLRRLDTTLLGFRMYRGNQIFVDGENRIVPVSELQFSTSGSPANTLIHVYAQWDGANVSLMQSLTAPTLLNGFWWWVMTGDGTKTWVGTYRTTASQTVRDDPQYRGVRSLFNHPALYGFEQINTQLSFSNTGVAIPAGAPEVSILTFLNDTVTFWNGGSVVSPANSGAGAGPTQDVAAVNQPMGYNSSGAANSDGNATQASTYTETADFGWHLYTVQVKSPSGVACQYGNAADPQTFASITTQLTVQ